MTPALAWGAAIHAAGRCAVCSRTDGLEAHHLIRRNHHATVNDLRCGILLCTAHHRGLWSAHNKPRWFMEWLEKHRPEQFAWVQANRWKIVK